MGAAAVAEYMVDGLLSTIDSLTPIYAVPMLMVVPAERQVEDADPEGQHEDPSDAHLEDSDTNYSIYRARLLPERNLLVMGPLHPHMPAHRGSIHLLRPADSQDPGCP